MKQKKLRNARLCINKFKGKMTCLSSVLLISFLLPACNTVYEAERIDASDLDNEPRVAFVRPDKYSFAIFGSRSIKEHVEITYERFSTDNSGYPLVELGLRNKGGQSFWDNKATNITLSIKTNFYKEIKPSQGAPVYETNWRQLRIVRGDTVHYKVLCPVKLANSYQIRISENIK